MVQFFVCLHVLKIRSLSSEWGKQLENYFSIFLAARTWLCNFPK